MSEPSDSRIASISQLHSAITAIDIFLADPQYMRGIIIKGPLSPVRDSLQSYLNQQIVLHRLSPQTTHEQLYEAVDTQKTLSSSRLAYRSGLLSQYRQGAFLLNFSPKMSGLLSRSLSNAIDTLAPDDMPRLVVFDENSDDDFTLAESPLAERLAIHIFVPSVTQSESQQVWLEHEQERKLCNGDLPTTVKPELVRLGDVLLRSLCQLCVKLGIVSHRPALHCARVARIHAALHDRQEVTEADLTVAIQLTLAPRATLLPDNIQMELQEPDKQDDSRNDSSEQDDEFEDESRQQSLSSENTTDNSADLTTTDKDSKNNSEEQAMEQQFIDAASAVLPNNVLNTLTNKTRAFRKNNNKPSSGKGDSLVAFGSRGRASGVRRARGQLNAQRVDILETIKAAIPFQVLRRNEAQKTTELTNSPQFHFRAEDIRVTRFTQAARTTTVFVVDASGSTALQRLAEAKGAIELLLAECYIRRDRVALITFRAAQAKLELPPTRSLTRAKRTLKALPGGGGTPLAAGIKLAAETATQLQQAGEIPVVVFMTDASANIALDGSASRVKAAIDAEHQARLVASMGMRVLFIDTSPRPRVPAQKLASAMRAHYLPLPRANVRAIPEILRAVG